MAGQHTKHRKKHTQKKDPSISWGQYVNPGGDLLSHTVTSAVPSALLGLTSVFGMGTGGTPTLKPPEIFYLTHRDH